MSHPSNTALPEALRAPRIEPKERQDAPEAERDDGWGFADTRFEARTNGSVVLTGSRYTLSNQELPGLLPWISATLQAPLSPSDRNEPHYPPEIPGSLAEASLLDALVQALEPARVSTDERARLRRGHGQTGSEIHAIRYAKVDRVPDVVVFPRSEDEVAALVAIARSHRACLLPFGGGTNVSEALKLSSDERRAVIAVDMRRMNRVLWIDPANRMACIEAGATGRELATALAQHGFTMGHEPDSMEFSTLGGWIATNASGMKKNRYGNIEDLVLDVNVVSACGVLSRPGASVPRESIGTNPKSLSFGSEGNFGIITSAIVKLFPLPEVQRYGSIIFPDLEHGFACLYALSRSGALPASVRLMDNTQFHFGRALAAHSGGWLAGLKSRVEREVVTRVKGFDPTRMTVATLVFEGSAEEVAFQERMVYRIASVHQGMKAGSSNGERGYQLTFGIAYIRDFAFEHWTIAESFETSVPWSRAIELYQRVKARVEREHTRLGLPGKPFFTGRITQVYTTGVCIYFYLGFYTKGVDEPVAKYMEMEHAAREEILAAGGSLSHHHGVGKLRRDFLPQVQSGASLESVAALKRALDPDDLFAAHNGGVMGAANARA